MVRFRPWKSTGDAVVRFALSALDDSQFDSNDVKGMFMPNLASHHRQRLQEHRPSAR